MCQKKGGDASQPITNRLIQPKSRFCIPVHCSLTPKAPGMCSHVMLLNQHSIVDSDHDSATSRDHTFQEPGRLSTLVNRAVYPLDIYKITNQMPGVRVYSYCDHAYGGSTQAKFAPPSCELELCVSFRVLGFAELPFPHLDTRADTTAKRQAEPAVQLSVRKRLPALFLAARSRSQRASAPAIP